MVEQNNAAPNKVASAEALLAELERSEIESHEAFAEPIVEAGAEAIDETNNRDYDIAFRKDLAGGPEETRA